MTDHNQIKAEYQKRFENLKHLASQIENDLRDHLKEYPRIDKITARAKTVERFIEKAFRKDEKGELKYYDPINQIQDQIGARIVTYYLNDVDAIAGCIKAYYAEIEEKYIAPSSVREFSYEGKHFILFVPDEYIDSQFKDNVPKYFELQIKTLFQHAWAESEHDLGYKSKEPLSDDDKRLLAFSAAQAWGADRIFNDMYTKYN